MNYKMVELIFLMGISFLNCSYEQTNVADNCNAKHKILVEEQKVFFKQAVEHLSFAQTVWLFSSVVIAGSVIEVFTSRGVCSKEFFNAAFKGACEGGGMGLFVFVPMNVNVACAKALNYIMK